MSYRLEAEETLSDGLKRILHEQTDKALDSLRSLEPNLDEAIHDARKRFKKCRAVVRLVRDEIGEDIYKRENIAYRDAGRALSDLRDAYSSMETLDAVLGAMDNADADDIQDAAERIREQLQHIYDEARAAVDQDNAIETVISDIEAAQERIDDLPIDHEDYSAIDDGLKRVYKRGVKRMADAYDQTGYPDIEKFHEWRKRVKYLWYHTRILENIWADVLDELGDEIHQLSDYLGDAHDIAELYEVIKPHIARDDSGGRKILAYMDYERGQLEKAARPLAQRIYAESKKDFVRRIGAYWNAWRHEQQADFSPELG
jgi:CHAD domain-containing protein